MAQQPGAAVVVNQNDNAKNKELEELKKLLAVKDAEIAALKAQNAKSNQDVVPDEDETKLPPKMDVCLLL